MHAPAPDTLLRWIWRAGISIFNKLPRDSYHQKSLGRAALIRRPASGTCVRSFPSNAPCTFASLPVPASGRRREVPREQGWRLSCSLVSAPRRTPALRRGAGNVCRREKHRQGFHPGRVRKKPFVSLDTCVSSVPQLSGLLASSRGKDQTS